jgi:hypothetical protein
MDVALGKDDGSIRTGHATQNMTIPSASFTSD